MAIDFDNLNDFTRRTPVILSAADVLDWFEKMTTDVKVKIHDGLKAGVSYEDINNSLEDNSMDVVKMSCYIMTNMANIYDVEMPFMLGMDNRSLVDVYEDAKLVADNKGWGGPQENQVRKELNVPVDDKDDDMEKSV